MQAKPPCDEALRLIVQTVLFETQHVLQFAEMGTPFAIVALITDAGVSERELPDLMQRTRMLQALNWPHADTTRRLVEHQIRQNKQILSITTQTDPVASLRSLAATWTLPGVEELIHYLESAQGRPNHFYWQARFKAGGS